jgi:hypothetical protein
MDLLIKLATQLDNNEFDQALNYIKEVNKKGLVKDYIDLVKEILGEGADLGSAIHFAYMDLLIDPETGKEKS